MDFGKQIYPTYLELYKKHIDSSINIEKELEKKDCSRKKSNLYQKIIHLAKSEVNEFLIKRKMQWGQDLSKFRKNLQKNGISISEKSVHIRRWLHLYEQLRNLIAGKEIEPFLKSDLDPPELYIPPTIQELKIMISNCIYQKELIQPGAVTVQKNLK